MRSHIHTSHRYADLRTHHTSHIHDASADTLTLGHADGRAGVRADTLERTDGRADGRADTRTDVRTRSVKGVDIKRVGRNQPTRAGAHTQAHRYTPTPTGLHPYTCTWIQKNFVKGLLNRAVKVLLKRVFPLAFLSFFLYIYPLLRSGRGISIHFLGLALPQLPRTQFQGSQHPLKCEMSRLIRC